MLRASLFALVIFISTSSLFLGPDPKKQHAIPAINAAENPIIDGVTMVAPPREFPGNPMIDVANIGAGWISTVPYGFMRIGQPNIRFNTEKQWWGETKAGIEKTIDYAHQHGIKVMLKPQIWSHNGWIGDQAFTNDNDWKEWEDNYTEFILFYAKIAAKKEVDMFCIGTELKLHVSHNPKYFVKLIDTIREIYCGKLIYSANWDSYKSVDFWDKLDYIGLSAYFPLNEKSTPSVNYLIKQWSPVEKELEKYSAEHNKKIVFTEYGYLSVDGSGGKTWLLEKNVKSLDVNEQAQANCFEALYKVFGDKPYWAGGFLWKWFPFGQGGEGYNSRDYTPQGKKAEKIVRNYYSKW